VDQQQQQQQQSVKGQSGILDQCPALFATALLPGHAVYVEYATRVRSRYSVVVHSAMASCVSQKDSEAAI